MNFKIVSISYIEDSSFNCYKAAMYHHCCINDRVESCNRTRDPYVTRSLEHDTCMSS